VKAQVALFLAWDSQHAAQHDQPFRIRALLPAWPRSVDRWETGGAEKLENIRPGLVDPGGGHLAGGAGRGHGALLSAQDGTSLPQLAPLAKCRDPSYKYNLPHIIDLAALAAIAAQVVSPRGSREPW
jgi:hypothetical protein